ncbi:MAG: S24 family peptidase, partial [Pseudomonas sp.]
TDAYPNWLTPNAQHHADVDLHDKPGRQSRVGPYISFDAYSTISVAGAVALTKRLSLATADVQRKLGFVPERGRVQLFTQRGPAMRPSMEDGDVAFIDTSVTAFVADDCYLVQMGQMLQLKRLQRRGDQVWVISGNDQFPSWPWTEESDLTIRGKLVLRLALHAA